MEWEEDKEEEENFRYPLNRLKCVSLERDYRQGGRRKKESSIGEEEEEERGNDKECPLWTKTRRQPKLIPSRWQRTWDRRVDNY